MSKQTRLYRQLVRRYRNGQASEEEVALFMDLMRQEKHRAAVEHVMDEELGVSTVRARRKSILIWLRYAAAVSLLTLAGWAAFYFLQTATTEQKIQVMKQVPPASSKATLRLANGDELSLDSTSGQLLLDSEAIRNEKGEILHQDQQATAFYEMVVPMGGTYQLSLSDGSKVWLNSGSTLRFPQQFAAQRREIELKGEAFFEIKKQTDAAGHRIPFIVNTARQQIEVLGTQFNVKAYTDETSETATLVAGSVRVRNKSDNEEKLLNPGFRSVLHPNGTMSVSKADLEEVSGWRADAFVFNDAAIGDIVKQLARWYNIDVVYTGSSDSSFHGYMPRNIPLGEALETLKSSGELEYSYQHGKVYIKTKKRPM
ncbi:FecR family protein [Sphingobacterium paludis]|uniref:FecR family protein n=1 Tax=Sphingobacterium paludis TaxID=1476465 RepID=A0A4R7D145_9SPHI|nr:FecR family protein [Sphingobacterium paludis]TDS14679.1 FecR family protein [Sphingobacterium paludis]